MVRIKDIEISLDFFCNKLGLIEINRVENDKGKFTLIFLAAPNDVSIAQQVQAPLLELTYNWPDENGKTEDFDVGRSFGHLAYRVENIYDICQNLMDHGIIINRPPRDGRMAFIKTPDNISIELLQKGAPLDLAEPWLSMQNIGKW